MPGNNIVIVLLVIYGFGLLVANGFTHQDSTCPFDNYHNFECDFLAKQKNFHAMYGMEKQSDGSNRVELRLQNAVVLSGSTYPDSCAGSSITLRGAPLQCPIFIPDHTRFDNISLNVNGEYLTIRALRD